MTTRRKMLLTLGVGALAWKDITIGQSQAAPILIAWLNTGSRESSGHFFIGFRERLAALGWKVGPQFQIEERWVEGKYDRLQALAEELAAKKPAVIVAGPLQSVVAAAKAAPKIPIVQADGGDLVMVGLAASLARPGGMVTGLTNIAGEIAEKQLELLLEVSPKLRRVGFLSDPGNLNLPRMMEAVRRSLAAKSTIKAYFAEATRPEQIEPAISRLAREGAQALVVLKSAMFRIEQGRIAKLVLARRWPAVTEESALAEAGLLLSYGHDPLQNYRRAAYFVDRILKGAKPGELPIEQPTIIELVVNLKTAKALGIKLPQSIRVRADRVIE